MTPTIGITVGDYAGVGPELLLRTWRELAELHPFVAYGSIRALRAAAADLVAREVILSAPAIVAADGTPDGDDAIRVIDVEADSDKVLGDIVTGGEYPWGRAVPAFGAIQYHALVRAVADTRAGRCAAIVTLPWHKARLADADLPPTGHTEVLAQECGVHTPTMLLAGDVLRVALATVHVPLSQVTGRLHSEGIVATGQALADGLRDLYGIAQPRISVCGLNPHAGEGGVIGDEEARVIAPAIESLRALGIDADGPWPADTLFPLVANGVRRTDGIIAMYHDQGLAPLKSVHFGSAANITLGLPIIRTSVDHGTAYDIAGTGMARPDSFLYAYRCAVDFVRRRS